MVVSQLIFGNRNTQSISMDAVKEALVLLVSRFSSTPLVFFSLNLRIKAFIFAIYYVMAVLIVVYLVENCIAFSHCLVVFVYFLIKECGRKFKIYLRHGIICFT